MGVQRISPSCGIQGGGTTPTVIVNNFVYCGGATSGSKVAETLLTPVLAETDHLIPEGKWYHMASGSKLDVYLNGQLLNHDRGSIIRDYIETSTTTIKFHYGVLEKSTLTYVIK